MRTCLTLFLILAGVRLEACDCKPAPAAKAALEGATAVFLAEATDVQTNGQTRTVKFKVETWWKGGDAAEVTVTTHKSSATCGYPFEKGKKYLVYAGGDKKAPSVSLCSRTRTAEQAEKDGDEKELGEGQKPAVKG